MSEPTPAAGSPPAVERSPEQVHLLLPPPAPPPAAEAPPRLRTPRVLPTTGTGRRSAASKVTPERASEAIQRAAATQGGGEVTLAEWLATLDPSPRARPSVQPPAAPPPLERELVSTLRTLTRGTGEATQLLRDVERRLAELRRLDALRRI